MRRALPAVFAVSAAVSLLAGCDLVPSQASCDFRPGTAECTDLLTNRNNQLRPTLQALCVGKYSDSLCNHAGALGGCRCETCENGVGVTWYFSDTDGGVQSAADVMKLCKGYPYVAP